MHYYKGSFDTKLKHAAVGATSDCQNLFHESDLKVEFIEDLSPKVDASDAVSAEVIKNTTLFYTMY